MRRKVFSVLGVYALVSLASGMAVADDVMQEMRDRAAIEDLMWRYVRALDTLDADGYAAVFTEDGQFGSGANATKGRAALKQMVVNLRQGRTEREANGAPPTPPMYHVIANSRLEFVGADRARMEAYWMTVFGPEGQGAQPRVAAVGRSVDDLVRVNGQWLIRTRDVAPQD